MNYWITFGFWRNSEKNRCPYWPSWPNQRQCLCFIILTYYEICTEMWAVNDFLSLCLPMLCHSAEQLGILPPVCGWKQITPGSSWPPGKSEVIFLLPNFRKLCAAVPVRNLTYHDPLYYQWGNENFGADLVPKWVCIFISRSRGSQFSEIRWYECYLNDMSHFSCG